MEVPAGRMAAPGAWQTFRRNRLAMTGAVLLAVLLALSLLLPPVLRDPNLQQIEFARLPPLATRTAAVLPDGTRQALAPSAAVVPAQGDSLAAQLASGLPVVLPPGTVLDTHTYWLGSDAFGRDTLARLVAGARVSLGVGALAVVLSLLVGVTLGAVSGYFGGWPDAVVQWVMAVIWSLPSLLLAIAIAFAIGRGFAQLFLAVGLTIWVEVARIIRGEVLSLRSRTFVEAARSLGFGSGHILLRELLPNLVGPVVILSTANFATAILLEAGLSFLGLGVRPPTPSWGSMIYEGYTYLLASNGKWLAVWPGLAIVVTIVSLHLVGLGLRDAFDPKRSR